MTSFFSLSTNPKVSGTDTVWVNTEENKIPIIDGKVTFHDETTGAKFELYVTQVKGRGVADADKLTELSSKHRLVLELMIDMNWEKYTAKQIKTLVENHFKNLGITADPNHYNRTI